MLVEGQKFNLNQQLLPRKVCPVPAWEGSAGLRWGIWSSFSSWTLSTTRNIGCESTGDKLAAT